MKLLTIKLSNVCKKYNKIVVLDNLNVIFDNKKVNFILSPNGMGKTTLIKVILNLTTYNGKISTNCNSFAYCPEKILLPDFIKVINFLYLFNVDKIHTQYLLNKFKLDPNLLIKKLSKGMHQKLLLIQCLAVNVDAYFFDEPLNGLDEESEKVFINEIYRLYSNNKLIVISSHYIERYKMLNCNIFRLVKHD